MTDREAITIAAEKFDEFYSDARPLIEAHWREITHFPDVPLNPDITRYRAMCEFGVLRCYVARDPLRKVCGYALFLVSRSLHYADSVVAMEDVIYVDQALRGGLLGKRLVEFSEQQLLDLGVEFVTHHQKNAHPALGRLLAHLGYEPFETNWIKRLRRPGG